MNSLAVPIPARKGKILWTAPLAAVTVIGLGVVGVRSFKGGPSGFTGTFEPAAVRDLDVRIVKDGEIQAVNNIEIYSNVEGQTSILTIVKEGQSVKKGDVLITLDSSSIKQRIEDTTLDVEKAEADLTASRELVEIQKSQNAANLEAAEVAVKLAHLDLAEYTEGTFRKNLADAETAVKMAEITLKNAQENFKQTNDLFQKGFVTAVDVKNSETELTKATNTLNQAKLSLEVLTKYSHEKEMASTKSALAQSEQKLIRVQRENASQLNQRLADLHAKEQALSLQKRRLDRYKEQLEACTITAPADGLVVYASTGDRGGSTQIQEGATVRERQLLLRLPDTSSLKAVLRVQEAQISRLQPGQRALIKVVGLPKPVGATLTKISVLADSSQRWWNPDLKEYPVDLALDQAPPSVKPGVSVNAEIYVNRLSQVLTVPLTSVYSSGTEAYVFSRAEPNPVPRKVKLGEVNETHAQVIDGITPGTPVLILQSGQGRDLLERAGIKDAPTTRPTADLDRRPPAPQQQAPTGGGPGGMTGGSRRSRGGDTGAAPVAGDTTAAPGGNGSGSVDRSGAGTGTGTSIDRPRGSGGESTPGTGGSSSTRRRRSTGGEGAPAGTGTGGGATGTGGATGPG